MTDSTDRDSDAPSEDRDLDDAESVADAKAARASEPGDAPVRRKKRRKKRPKDAAASHEDDSPTDEAGHTDVAESAGSEAKLDKKKEASPGWFAEHYLKADPRWLGVFRIVLGVILCVDLLRRWANAGAFYTNDGIYPNHYSLFAPMGRHVFSIYHAFSSYGEVSVAFGITLCVFLCFLFGYRTKLFHVLSAICITSLNARNLFVENGGTVVVNIITIWTLFLPLGNRLSLDAVRKSMKRFKERSAAELNDRSADEGIDLPVYRLAIFALILQWSVIYFFNTVHKSGHGWQDGSALHWFVYQDRIITAFGVWVRNNVPFGVLRFLTYATLVVEGTLAGILLIPFGQKWFRRLAFVLAFGLHGNIAAMSRLGPFSYVMVSFFVLMLGGADWAAVGRYFGKEKRRRTVIYDADCGICLLTCRILKRLDPFQRLTFVENWDLEKLPEGLDPAVTEQSVVAVMPDGSYRTESNAVFEIIRALPFGIALVWWLKVPPFSSLGMWLYRKIASNRIQISVWLGLGACGVARHAAANVPDEPKPWRESLSRFGGALRELGTLFLLVILGSQVMVDNSWVTSKIRIKRPQWVEELVDYPRLYQGWRMFAPEPPYDDGTVVVDARTVDGRKIDPLTGKEPDFNPDTPTGWGHNQFWCDYENKIRFGGNAHHRKNLEDYLMKYSERTGNPKDKIVAFDVWWIEDKSPPPGQKHGIPRRPQKLISHGVVKDSLATPWLKQGGP
ncbi:MAG: DCC1-like thiol-disulfide oxidoreductase family protein [Polyangiaceae bacterium]